MIKFNKYIYKIGIEFEGLYKKSIEIDSLINNGYIFQTSDGSIQNDFESSWHYLSDPTLSSWHYLSELDRPQYRAYEMITKPMNEKELNQVIAIFDHLQKKKIYHTNQSCGLHFHISFKKSGFGVICNYSFYKKMENLFKNKYPKVYKERKDNRYCRAGLREDQIKDQFQKQASNRYHMVNYSQESRPDTERQTMETVEIRFYGGTYATVKQLGQVIQDTFNIIEAEIKKGRTIKNIIDVVNQDNNQFFSYPLKGYGDKIKSLTNFFIRQTNHKFNSNFIIRSTNHNNIINFS